MIDMMMIMIDMMIMTTIPCLGLLGAPLLIIATPVYEKPEVMLSIHIDDDNDGIHLNIPSSRIYIRASSHITMIIISSDHLMSHQSSSSSSSPLPQPPQLLSHL